VALQRTAFSKDGKHMAYSLSTNGSDWVTIKVLRILPNGVGVPLKDELQEVKFTCIAVCDLLPLLLSLRRHSRP
jgi:prolyl oligopeptidase